MRHDRFVGADSEYAKRRALGLIDRFGITSSSEIDLEAIAWFLGVHIREARMTGSEARLLRKGRRGIISVRKDVASEGRRRFSIAHELGHWILHEGAGQWWVCSAEDIYAYVGGLQELEANAFAAELVMPTPIFRPYCDRGTFGFMLVERLAELFCTSLTATALRVVEHSPERCCVVLSDGENVHWSWRSGKLPDYEYFIPKGFRLRQSSKAWSSSFEGNSGMSKVPPMAWFPNLPSGRGFEVWEESRYLEGYGVVLTLLSVNEY